MAEVDTPLFARIEELAARAAEDVGAERAISAEVSGVRAEMAALRADMARLAETLTSGLQAQTARLDGELRGPLEARLAALEDSLEGVAERLESFARDDANATAERLSTLTRGQADLRVLVADQSTNLAATLLEAQSVSSAAVVGRVEEAIGGLTGSVREAIDAFAGSVEHSLVALGGSVGTALAEARDAHHDHLDEISGSFDAGMEKVTTGHTQLATRLTEQAATLGATRADVTAAIESLNSDIAASLEASAVAAKKVLEDNDRTAASRIAEIKRGGDVASAAIDSLATKVASIAKTSAETQTMVGKLDEGWREVAQAVVERASEAAAAELDEFRERVGRELESVRGSLGQTIAAVVESRTELDAGTRRLDASGQALLQYLAERDLVLEEERDRILRDVLDEFAKGLDAKSRKHLSMRVSEAMDRSRDARDADRYRKTKAGAPVPDPVPLVVAPVTPVRVARTTSPPAGEVTRPAPRERLARPAKPATSVRAAKPAKPAEPVKATKPAKPAPAKPAPTKAAPTKAAPTKAAKPAAGRPDAPTEPAATPAQLAKAATAKQIETAKSEGAPDGATAGTQAATGVRKGRATVDSMPTVSSPSSAIDAAAGEGTGVAHPQQPAETESGAAVGAAAEAFAAATASRRRFGGRRPRS